MSGGPYDDDDEYDDGEVAHVGDPSVAGVGRAPLPDLRPGVALRQGVNSRAVGVAPTPLDYDPRTAAGVALTRLDYDPRRYAGSTGVRLIEPDIARSMIENARTVPEWVAGWLQARGRMGLLPPAWGPSLLSARGRPDLAAYCAQLSAYLAAHGVRG